MAQVHGITSSTPVSADDAPPGRAPDGGAWTSSRVRILARLREGACSVGALTEAVEMAQPAAPHQLRVMRDLGLVVGSRDGRHTIYGLHDAHVAMFLDEALHHIGHLRTGAALTPQGPSATDPQPSQPRGAA